MARGSFPWSRPYQNGCVLGQNVLGIPCCIRLFRQTMAGLEAGADWVSKCQSDSQRCRAPGLHWSDCIWSVSCLDVVMDWWKEGGSKVIVRSRTMKTDQSQLESFVNNGRDDFSSLIVNAFNLLGRVAVWWWALPARQHPHATLAAVAPAVPTRLEMRWQSSQ